MKKTFLWTSRSWGKGFTNFLAVLHFLIDYLPKALRLSLSRLTSILISIHFLLFRLFSSHLKGVRIFARRLRVKSLKQRKNLEINHLLITRRVEVLKNRSSVSLGIQIRKIERNLRLIDYFHKKMNQNLKLNKFLIHWLLCQMLSDITVVKSSNSRIFYDYTTSK